MLFYTGVTRSANSILAGQTANINVIHDQLDRLRDLVGLAADRLRREDADAVGEATLRSMTTCDAAAETSYPPPRLSRASYTLS